MLFLEYFTGIGGEGGGGVDAGDGVDGGEGECIGNNLLFLRAKIGGEVDKEKDNAACDKPHYPYELPRGWCWCKLEDFMNDATDFVANGSFASLRENVKYYDEPEYAILVRTKDFQNGFTKGLVYTDQHGYDFLANSNLFGGELILPNIGTSIGKVFIVPKLSRRMTLAPNSIMVKCFDDTHKKWLQYLFMSPFGQEQLRIISSSTAQGKFNKTDLRALYVPIPPQKEQQRILKEIEFLFHFVEIIENGQICLQGTIKQAKCKILDLAIHGKLVPQDPMDEPAAGSWGTSLPWMAKSKIFDFVLFYCILKTVLIAFNTIYQRKPMIKLFDNSFLFLKWRQRNWNFIQIIL